MQWIAIAVLIICLTNCAKDYRVKYLDIACLEPHDKFDFRVCKDFRVQIDNKIFTVPKHFKTDLASIPRPLWAIYAPNDSRTIPAAILHDYMYRFKAGVTRKESDDIFYRALIESGTRKRRAIKYYIVVRLFGGFFYNGSK